MSGARWPGARVGAVLAVLALGAPAAAYMPRPDDDLEVLRDAAQRWTFDIVEGDSLDQLAVMAGATPVSCGVQNVTSTTSQFVCDTSATAQPLLAGLVSGSRTLVWDGKGVRELRGPASPESTADIANALALTFPRALTASRRLAWKSPSGATAALSHSLGSRMVQGAKRTVWISEATTTAARVSGMPAPVAVRTVAVFAPALGPVLLCHTRAPASPAYVCLRLADEVAAPAPAPRAPGRPAAAPTATLTVTRKLTRLTTSLTAAKVAAKVTSSYGAGLRRCYAEARKAKPRAAGKLALKFTVNAVGKTEAINVTSFDDGLTGCVKSQLATWRFPIPQGEYGSPIAARYELDLKLGLTK